MGHSGDFARWPHLGPIRPMARGGHLGPLSYVYGYRGGIGRRSSVEMTPATKLGHQSGDMSSLYGAAWPFLCPNRPFPRWADVGQRKNGRSVEKNLSAVRFLWAVLGGVKSGGWGQFGEVKKKTVVMPSRRVQLDARCAICPWGVELGPIQRLFSAVRVFPGLSGFPRDRVLGAIPTCARQA